VGGGGCRRGCEIQPALENAWRDEPERRSPAPGAVTVRRSLDVAHPSAEVGASIVVACEPASARLRSTTSKVVEGCTHEVLLRQTVRAGVD
jgi:hypothetical protein